MNMCLLKYKLFVIYSLFLFLAFGGCSTDIDKMIESSSEIKNAEMSDFSAGKQPVLLDIKPDTNLLTGKNYEINFNEKYLIKIPELKPLFKNQNYSEKELFKTILLPDFTGPQTIYFFENNKSINELDYICAVISKLKYYSEARRKNYLKFCETKFKAVNALRMMINKKFVVDQFVLTEAKDGSKKEIMKFLISPLAFDYLEITVISNNNSRKKNKDLNLIIETLLSKIEIAEIK